MIPHTLTAENYFSPEMSMKYMGSSQFKSFQKCEASALAELRGEYERPVTDALLIGSYVDAHFEGTLDIFKAKHPEIFTQKGELKAQYKHAEYMIQRAERDDTFMRFMSGQKQVIMVGEIAGVPYKIKVDSLHENAIVDLKAIKDFMPLWNEDKHVKQHFIHYWSYDIQGAIYREVVRQNTGNVLPFYIAAITKEKPEPNLQVYWIPDEDLDNALNEVKSLSPRFQQIKEGKIQPQRCGDCDYCRFTKVLTGPVNFHEEMEVYDVER
jgi:hypothetical protein